MFPHQGFHGSRPIIGCNCCTCATKWYLTDAERIEKHNSKIEAPLKEAFVNEWVSKHGNKTGCEWNWSQHRSAIRSKEIALSHMRTAILKDVCVLFEKERDSWHPELAQLLRSKKKEEEIEFIRKISRLLITLLREECERNIRLKELLKPSSSEDWGLRTHMPTGLRVHKKWNNRTHMNE